MDELNSIDKQLQEMIDRLKKLEVRVLSQHEILRTPWTLSEKDREDKET